MALHLLKICGIKHDLEDFNYVKGRAVACVKKGDKGLEPPAASPAPSACLSDLYLY